MPRFTTRQLLSATLFVAVLATCWTNMRPWADRALTPLWLWFLAWGVLGATLGNIWSRPLVGLFAGLLIALVFAQVRAPIY